MAVPEAMLCEYVPAGTKCNGITIAKGASYYVNYGDLVATAQATKMILASPTEERISAYFLTREERIGVLKS